MKKKLYVISGITDQLAERWGKDFREDLKLYRNVEDKILAEIKLSFIEAIVMKREMKKYNSKNSCKLELIKVKGKRYRV